MNQPQPKNPAETYEHYFVPAMFLPWTALLLRHAAPQSRERVLDVACGTGIVTRQVAPLVGADGQVVALDMNPAMLAVARALPVPPGAAIQWQEGNAMALLFPDGVFDIVLCQHGLQFFPDRAGAVREMRRVLAPGGQAVVIVLQALARHPVFAALMESVAHHLSLPVSAVMTRLPCRMLTNCEPCLRPRGSKPWPYFLNQPQSGFPNRTALCHLPLTAQRRRYQPLLN
ncbi:class I SAM-dependent methyltransferase [Rugosibacter aromaticivorans]|uniref:class I SAM-dependent methyltransferase n=1 Tax=Rugosibacter aromaticivorans TaxID=1565605 RepID=UPI000A5D2F4C|nr:methyltransferase domain-containing protein [Rugosibacter aromaticivorans]